MSEGRKWVVNGREKGIGNENTSDTGGWGSNRKEDLNASKG